MTTDTEGLRLTEDQEVQRHMGACLAVAALNPNEKHYIQLFRALSRALEMEGSGQTMEPPIFSKGLLFKLWEWLLVETGDGEFVEYVVNYLEAVRAVRGSDD